MEFLSDPWLAALDDAARARSRAGDDRLADVTLRVDQTVVGVRTWRLAIDRGDVRVVADPDDPGDVELRCDRATAVAVAGGQRSALDAFIAGDLELHGDPAALLQAREALEELGDLFATVKAETDFTPG